VSASSALHSDVSRLFDLHGRTAIVTGGSRGLGFAMAVGLAKAGANVVIASRKLDACERAAAEIDGMVGPGRTLAHAVRMNAPEDLAPLVDATLTRFGGISIVVNNAATVLDRSLAILDVDAFTGAFTTNLLTPLLLVQGARPALATSGHGSVVNIVSIAAFGSSPGRYLYPPVKAGLAQVTATLARDLAPDNIRVNAISPGTFRTDMVTKAFDDATLDRIAASTPLRRVPDASEMVGPALFLCSDAASFVTGTVLTVDGGATA
jgi:NAD(P)-dependent dehydrogenase (short-subunit alcohol dehydrogenase family)